MKSRLDQTKDYIITNKYPLESFLDSSIQILSVFSDTGSKLNIESVYTPKQYLTKVNDKKLLLLYEPELIIPLDYLDTINELRKHGHHFIAYTSTTEEFSYLINPVLYCINQEYHIKAIGNERFYFLYYICKNRLFDGSIYIIAENNEYKRINMLLSVFLGPKLEHNDTIIKFCSEITLASSISKLFYNNVIVFNNKKVGMNCDRMIYVCEKIDVKQYMFDYGMVRNEKYRLDDLINNLTKNVITGKKEIDLKRFSSLKCR